MCFVVINVIDKMWPTSFMWCNRTCGWHWRKPFGAEDLAFYFCLCRETTNHCSCVHFFISAKVELYPKMFLIYILHFVWKLSVNESTCDAIGVLPAALLTYTNHYRTKVELKSPQNKCMTLTMRMINTSTFDLIQNCWTQLKAVAK